ncbi:S9 family peptidase [Flavisolibacter ginsenosidimutans]|uniref:Prolyl oligopeptidase family serine peptidase n=1 Tax=Flavisolibacter ginsenosidimutans TaxID=661481 RepID=A0A5B8ULU6_9BACT|nr:prolyl oligopeptidase family serine peptidase [Flavisolibacter ginsenosidimutans]QEC57647.1 prolyl oligopeptidase family serine peptidase [Flavisolibacter ginsenosidimutans]
MKKIVFSLSLLLFSTIVFAQKNLTPLTVEKIMRDPKWMGTSPSNPYWSADGRYLFFSWNPDKAESDSLYYITLSDRTPKKATVQMQQNIPSFNSIVYNTAKTAYTYTKDGDLFYVDAQKREHRVTQTVEAENSPQFIERDAKIAFTRAQNIYAFDIASGLTAQLTNFVRGTAQKEAPLNAQEKWLSQDALRMSQVLRERKARRDSAEAIAKRSKPRELRSIYTEDKNVFGSVVSPDGRFVAYRLFKPANAKNTIVPNYVTETGFTTDINGRSKVGAPQSATELYIFDREKDTVLLVKADGIPGLYDLPDYVKDYPSKDTGRKKPMPRSVNFRGPVWNDEGTKAVVDVRSADNKDRWIMLLDPATGTLKNIDRQRDEAWVAGPGIFSSPIWTDENNILFQSEADGYSHIYKVDINTGTKTQLTKGAYEISNLQLSKDRKIIYYTANDLHPGDYRVYRISVNGGTVERLTSQAGISRFTLSPDEKTMAVLYSYSNKPWELYLQETKATAKLQQITNLAMSEELKSYPWRDPEIVTFTARDGATVYARLYKPSTQAATKPAVIFVHGAGYLQNVHKGWSTYFREYMFNNLLADGGYTVLDIDYRGSEGYGRNWRTGIYRHMGGKDLDDQVDGANYLVKTHNVDPKRIGIYGGSYGGFMTLMAMFTQPGVFAAGAGLRSVTDWAHYNHGYTSNILNEPYNDSLAYKRSSPIYYAEGLKGHLLMCHGMVDQNVHFQDIVRITQRLIELGKNNWELAVYPVEDHGFVDPSSWTDEYKRVLKLFEEVLK